MLFLILNHKYDVLYDDTSSSAGKKFADMDLLGISWQIIIGPKHAINNSVELKNRKTGEVKILKEEELYNIIKEI